MIVLEIVNVLMLIAIGLPLAYLYILAIASIYLRSSGPSSDPIHRFAIAIPAHNEEAVIARTVEVLHGLDYPGELFDIFVVADFCSDNTATTARNAGAIVFERDEGLQGSKGAALRWLFDRVLDEQHSGIIYDAFVTFGNKYKVIRLGHFLL